MQAQYKSAIWTHDERQQEAVQKLFQDYSDSHSGKQVLYMHTHMHWVNLQCH